MVFLLYTTLLACNQGKLGGDCPEGQVLDDDGNCVDEIVGDGGTTSDGGSADGGSGDGGGDGGTDGGGDGGTDCGVTVSMTSPADGATGVELGALVLFELSDGDPTASLSLATSAGAAVSGTTWLAESNTEVWFQPGGPLASATSYVASLDYCGGVEQITFTTMDPGDPVSELEGQGWSIDLTEATWTEPAGLGGLIAGMLESDLLLGVSAASETSISMYGTLSDSAGSQDTCEPTVDFPAADFRENPYFQLGPTDLPLDLGGVSATLMNLRLGGTFSADASRIEDGELSGQIDMRELGPLFEDLIGTSDAETICTVISGFGAECEACLSDGEETCLSVAIEDIVGNRVTDGVDQITQENCHPDCSASYRNPDCDTSGW